jgi:hypothetical protein
MITEREAILSAVGNDTEQLPGYTQMVVDTCFRMLGANPDAPAGITAKTLNTFSIED